MKSEQVITKAADFKTLPNYVEYPFEVEGIEYRSYVTKEDEELAVSQTTGELYVVKKMPKGKRVIHDKKAYTKFFLDNANLIINLSVPASNMLYMIMSKLAPGSLEICVTEDDFIDYCGYKRGSKRLYYQAIAELVELNVIKRKARFMRCYWINANIIFNGDRTKIKL